MRDTYTTISVKEKFYYDHLKVEALKKRMKVSEFVVFLLEYYLKNNDEKLFDEVDDDLKELNINFKELK